MSKWEKIDPADIKVGDRIKKMYSENCGVRFTVTAVHHGIEDVTGVRFATVGGNTDPYVDGDPIGIRSGSSSLFYRKVKKVKPTPEVTWSIVKADDKGATFRAVTPEGTYEVEVELV